MRALIRLVCLGVIAGCGVEVSADDMPANPSVATDSVTPSETIPVVMSAPLTGVLYSDRDAELAARIDGVVREIFVELGDAVKEGAVLAQLDDGREAARVSAAQAAVDHARAEHARTRALHDKRLITDVEYETSLYQLRAREAELQAMQVELGYTRVTAPFAGVITRRMTGVGKPVRAGEPLYRLTALQPLRMLLRVAEADARVTRVGTRILLESAAGDATYGTVERISAAVDPASGTVELLVAVPRPGALRPGSAVTAQLAAARNAAK